MFTNSDYISFEEKAIYVADQCAGFIRSSTNNLVYTGKVHTKSTNTDPVTELDKSSELLARKIIKEFDTNYVIQGEEFGEESTESELSWIIDPIDGTVNFIYGIPACAVSVAVRYKDSIIAGAVAEIPTTTIFSASLENGARMRKGEIIEELHLSEEPVALSESLIATGFAYNSQVREQQAKIVTNLLPAVRDIRRIGSASLDLCMVAAGKVDGYYEHGLGVWDYAAGALIAKEAGAEVKFPDFRAGYADRKLTYATRPGLSEELLQILAKTGNEQVL